jgi:ATP-dependent protease ClpP protease subunit
MVGHKIHIRANATMMIHLPTAFVMGNAMKLMEAKRVLDTITEGMLNVYAKKSRRDREEIRAMLEAETWFTPEQAVEKGFRRRGARRYQSRC